MTLFEVPPGWHCHRKGKPLNSLMLEYRLAEGGLQRHKQNKNNKTNKKACSHLQDPSKHHGMAHESWMT